MSYLSRLKSTETPIQGAVSEKQKRLSGEVPKLTQTYQDSQAANGTTKARIWRVVTAKDDIHCIEPRPVTAETIRERFPEARLIDPAFPEQANGTETQGRAVLAELAREFNHPLPKLLEFYRDDLPDFATMSLEQARFIVREHLEGTDRTIVQ